LPARLDLHRKLGNRCYEAVALTHLGETHLGETHLASGRRDAAREAWRRALIVLHNLDHPDAAVVRSRLHQRDDLGQVPEDAP
jgi:hypothetical protein